MLIIRDVQRGALDETVHDDFLRGARAYAGDCFPEEIAALGEAATRALLRAGTMRAADYGIAAREDVLLFLGLDLAFGAPFEASPEFPLARSILERTALPSGARMQLLYDVLPDDGED